MRQCLRILAAIVALVIFAPTPSSAQTRAAIEELGGHLLGGKLDKAEKMLAANPAFDVNVPFNDVANQSIAFPIILNGKVDAVRFLIAHGMKVDYQEKAGATALHTAIRSAKVAESVEIAKLLLDAGASPNLGNAVGTSPLMIAALRGRLDLMQLLIDRGALVKATNKAGSNALDAVDSFKGLGVYTKNAKLHEDVRVFLTARGLVNAVPYSEDAAIVKLQDEIQAENKQVTSDRVDKFTDALFDKPQGTGRLCDHTLLIGNITGSGLTIELMGKLKSGKWAKVAPDRGGKFRVPFNGHATNQVWLGQGGSYLLGAVSDRGRSWAGVIEFDVPITCDDRTKGSFIRRNFIVELDNAKSQLTVTEDKNKDGRPDAPVVAAGAGGSADAVCTNLAPLATEIAPDNKRLMFADDQLAQMLSSAGCKLPDRIAQQRARLKDVLAKTP